MAAGKTPQNQLDALPLISAENVANPDVVEVVGNVMSKFWSPSTLGINGINRINDPFTVGNSLFLTPYLDARGVDTFVFLVTRTALNAAGDDVVAMSIFTQYRVGGVDPATGNRGANESPQLLLINFAALGGPFPQDATFNRGFSNKGPLSTQPAAALGSDLRFWFRWTVGAQPAGNQTFTIRIWAQG